MNKYCAYLQQHSCIKIQAPFILCLHCIVSVPQRQTDSWACRRICCKKTLRKKCVWSWTLKDDKDGERRKFNSSVFQRTGVWRRKDLALAIFRHNTNSKQSFPLFSYCTNGTLLGREITRQGNLNTNSKTTLKQQLNGETWDVGHYLLLGSAVWFL